MKKLISSLFFLLLAIFIIAGCGGKTNNTGDTTTPPDNNNSKPESLIVYSGAGLRKPMDEIGKAFEEKYGIKVTYNYAGSAQLLSQIELTQEGDVYIPGDLVDIEIAKEKGLVNSSKQVVYHIPVIAVPKGNPANIKSLEDLAKPGVKVILGDEKANAIGKLGVKIFEKNNILEAVRKNTVAQDATVNEIVVHITMKQGDAALVWEDNVVGIEELEMVEIPKEKNIIETIPIGALNVSKYPEWAQKFTEFVLSDEGKDIFKKHGFKPVD